MLLTSFCPADFLGALASVESLLVPGYCSYTALDLEVGSSGSTEIVNSTETTSAEVELQVKSSLNATCVNARRVQKNRPSSLAETQAGGPGPERRGRRPSLEAYIAHVQNTWLY